MKAARRAVRVVGTRPGERDLHREVGLDVVEVLDPSDRPCGRPVELARGDGDLVGGRVVVPVDGADDGEREDHADDAQDGAERLR